MSYELPFSPRSTAGSESHALPIPATRHPKRCIRSKGNRRPGIHSQVPGLGRQVPGSGVRVQVQVQGPHPYPNLKTRT